MIGLAQPTEGTQRFRKSGYAVSKEIKYSYHKLDTKWYSQPAYEYCTETGALFISTNPPYSSDIVKEICENYLCDNGYHTWVRKLLRVKCRVCGKPKRHKG